MFKRGLTLLFLGLTVAAFARTKEEIQKELAPLTAKYWQFPHSADFRKFEESVMLKDAAYVAAQKAENDAAAARTAFVDKEVSKTPEGKKLVDDRIAAEKALAEADEATKVEAAAANRAALAAYNDYVRKNNCTDWRNDEFRKLEMDFRNKSIAKINAGVEAMLKSDNAEAKTFAQAYKDLLAKMAQLREELKTAE